MRARRGRSWRMHAGADPKGAMPMAMSCGIDWSEEHTTWPWSTPTATWWPSGASVTTRPALASCWTCWPRPATTRRRRYRSRSRRRGGCCGVPARHWPSAVCDQPAGGGPLPPAASGLREEIRPRRRRGAGQRLAHRPGGAPAAAGRLRTGPRDRRAGPCPAGRGLGPNPGPPQAAVAAARVLPRVADGVPHRPRWDPAARARALLAAAPTPADAARLTRPELVGLLRQAGRQRRLATHAARLHQAFAAPCLRQPPLVEQAMGQHALALLGALNTACANAEELAAATRQAFDQHPDAKLITSFAGLGPLTGARVLAELGDDRSRFAAAKAVKAYAGAAPVTRASGKRLLVTHRRVKN